jgi:ATP-dependent helicase/nuclease subunit B
MTSRIFHVPIGVPFLPALARAILNGDLSAHIGQPLDPLSLPDTTLLLPTRRAARAAQEAFLETSGNRALLMPAIRPISQGDEDMSFLTRFAGLSGASIQDEGFNGLDLPPAIPSLTRTLVLMRLVQRWRSTLARAEPERQASGSNTPAQAANLAAELAKLMDDIERENIALTNLQSLVPEHYAEHWKQTVDFLKIITEYWPAYMAAEDLASPAARINALILQEAERIRSLPQDAQVIVAGVTGSIPATITLMRAVAERKTGAIVLPALDRHLDDASWQSIVPNHPEHPQYGLKKLLDALNVTRGDVEPLPGCKLNPARERRSYFISEAMRPSSTTAQWHEFTAAANPDAVKKSLEGLSLIEAPSAQDEADVVALILRDAVDTPGRTAALVSPDRLLARRVAIRLEAWGIRVDDSAGRPFAKTVPGTFLNLVVEAARSSFAPAETMALLKHPLCRLSLSPFDIRRYGRALEILAFRAPYLGRGLDGIRAALEKSEADRLQNVRMNSTAKRLWDEDRQGARDLVSKLEDAFAPFIALSAKHTQHTLASFAKAHLAAAEALAQVSMGDAAVDQKSTPQSLWQGVAGDTAQNFFTELLQSGSEDIAIYASEYADLYASLIARENVRERTPVHPRVAIWGPLEARLQQPDVIVLGALNEGTWPEAAEPGAWLNRPMRNALGLPAPEVEVGRSALDFVSLLGADQVFMTRATKIKGVPTVPSRWLMRIEALLAGMQLTDALKPDRPWLAWARARDVIDTNKRIRIAAPEPRPATDLRPRRLSVTRIEAWISNPYAIYARHILNLEPLPALGTSPDQSLRGALVHEVLSKFALAYPKALPRDLKSSLDQIAAEVLQSYTGHPRVAAFWLPRLGRFLQWFADTEPKRRDGVSEVIPETSGVLVLDAPGGPFTLTARADRIDDKGSALIITDYKTGGLPSDAHVLSGRAPQLPLEAAIALGNSGFPKLNKRSVEALRYIRASGGEPPGEAHDIKSNDMTALAAQALTGLTNLVALFDNPDTPYRAIRRPTYHYDYDDYAHLARVAEWSTHDNGEVGS